MWPKADFCQIAAFLQESMYYLQLGDNVINWLWRSRISLPMKLLTPNLRLYHTYELCMGMKQLYPPEGGGGGGEGALIFGNTGMCRFDDPGPFSEASFCSLDIHFHESGQNRHSIDPRFGYPTSLPPHAPLPGPQSESSPGALLSHLPIRHCVSA